MGLCEGSRLFLVGFVLLNMLYNFNRQAAFVMNSVYVRSVSFLIEKNVAFAAIIMGFHVLIIKQDVIYK